MTGRLSKLDTRLLKTFSDSHEKGRHVAARTLAALRHAIEWEESGKERPAGLSKMTIRNSARISRSTCTAVLNSRFRDTSIRGLLMSEVVNFPTGLKIDFTKAEVRRGLVAVPGEERTERCASACRSLEGEVCDLVLMAAITKGLADDLINKPGLPREADRLFYAVEQLTKQIREFKTRFFRRGDGAETDSIG